MENKPNKSHNFDIDKILKGYIECSIWTEEERLNEDMGNNIDQGENVSFDFEDVNENDIKNAYKDIEKFINLVGQNAIQEAIDQNGEFKLGMDIWFTRNGHGAGFFDHGYENEEALINVGKSLKEINLDIGSHGKLYFE